MFEFLDGLRGGSGKLRFGGGWSAGEFRNEREA